MPEPSSSLPFVKSDDFSTGYSNNIQLDATVWDLTMIFGQVDHTEPAVFQHTAVTVPWQQVKTMVYFLVANLVHNELMNGKVTVPALVTPPRPEINPALDQNTNRMAVYMAWVHDQLFGDNPYVPPGAELK